MSPRRTLMSPHRAPSPYQMASVLWCFRVFHDVSQCFKCVSSSFTGGLWCFTSGSQCFMCFTMFHTISQCFTSVWLCFTMFNNVLQCLVNRATIGIAALATVDGLRECDNAARICDNSTWIGDTSTWIVDNSAEIGDNSSHAKLCQNGDESNSVPGRQIPKGQMFNRVTRVSCTMINLVPNLEIALQEPSYCRSRSG